MGYWSGLDGSIYQAAQVGTVRVWAVQGTYIDGWYADHGRVPIPEQTHLWAIEVGRDWYLGYAALHHTWGDGSISRFDDPHIGWRTTWLDLSTHFTQRGDLGYGIRAVLPITLSSSTTLELGTMQRYYRLYDGRCCYEWAGWTIAVTVK